MDNSLFQLYVGKDLFYFLNMLDPMEILVIWIAGQILHNQKLYKSVIDWYLIVDNDVIDIVCFHLS